MAGCARALPAVGSHFLHGKHSHPAPPHSVDSQRETGGAAVSVRLHLKNSNKVGSIVTVEKSPYIIGRHEDCDLEIQSSRVSLFHCCITLNGGKVGIKDMDSTNGTRVNGEPVSGLQELQSGDTIWVGPALIEVHIERDPGASASQKPSYSVTNPYLKLSELE